MSKKLSLLIVLILSILIPSSCTDEAIKTNGPKEEPRHSTWIWNSKNINSDTIDRLLEMDINMVSINAGYEHSVGEQYLLNHKEVYDKFIDKALKNNIKTYALFGTPYWSYDEEYAYMKEQLKEVFDYNTLYKDTRFNGIHLDVEPHAIKDQNGKNLWTTWNTRQREGIIKELISNIKRVRDLIDNHNESSNDSLELIIDIAPGIPEYEIFAGKLFKEIDKMVLMNYTKYQNVYLENGKKYLEIANKYDKKVIVGSEFQKDYKDISLYYIDVFKLQDYFKEPLTTFKEYDSFNGLGIHGFFHYYEKMNN